MQNRLNRSMPEKGYGMKHPVVELSDCIQCEVCVDVCPAVFRMSDSGYIEVIELPSYPENAINDAIRNCPADCIAWQSA